MRKKSRKMGVLGRRLLVLPEVPLFSLFTRGNGNYVRDERGERELNLRQAIKLSDGLRDLQHEIWKMGMRL